MTKPETALTVAVIGAVVALAGSLLTNVVALRNERLRHEQAARDALIAEMRTRTADAFKQLLAIQHAIEWVTWHAKFDPEAIRTQELVSSYEREVHVAYPAFLGALAAATSISPTVYEDLRALLDRVYGIEQRVALALKSAKESDAKFTPAIDDLKEEYGEITRFLKEVLDQLPQVMDRAVEAADPRRNGPAPRARLC